MRDLFDQYDIHLNDEQVQLFERFLELFIEKNKQLNLSAIREPREIITKHFIDSCMLQRFLPSILEEAQLKSKQVSFLDLGSGGGFPGIPLAIIYPEFHFTLLDARRKKCEATKEFVENLNLGNISIAWGRAEDPEQWQFLHGKKNDAFDFILSRATAHIEKLLTWCKKISTRSSTLIAYKTPSTDEIEAFPKRHKKYTYSIEEQEHFIYSVMMD